MEHGVGEVCPPLVVRIRNKPLEPLQFSHLIAHLFKHLRTFKQILKKFEV